MPNSKAKSPLLADCLKALPPLPGVYFMINEYDEIIYIGKAVNLKRRVSGYFQKNKKHEPKILKMVSQVRRFEIVVTETELDALILECRQIKTHRPIYNALMKNDKRYPYIKLTAETFPRILLTHSLFQDGGTYFGPYHRSYDVEETMDILRGLWQIRRCNTALEVDSYQSVHRHTCLNHHLGKCAGPCCGLISPEDYRANLEEVKRFLMGETDFVFNKVKREMDNAAQALQFERAALMRDLLAGLERMVYRQNLLRSSLNENDLAAVSPSHLEGFSQLFFIRHGLLTDRLFLNTKSAPQEKKEALQIFFAKQYINPTPAKDQVLQSELDELTILQGWLRNNKYQKQYFTIDRKQKTALQYAVNETMKILSPEE